MRGDGADWSDDAREQREKYEHRIEKDDISRRYDDHCREHMITTILATMDTIHTQWNDSEARRVCLLCGVTFFHLHSSTSSQKS